LDENVTLELLTVLNHYTDREVFDDKFPWSRGGEQVTERLLHVADWCARTWPGDLVHITCQVSPISRALGAAARVHGRRLAVLLPWVEDDEPLPRPCRDDNHEKSVGHLAPYLDIADVMIGRSSFVAPEQVCLAVVNSFQECTTYLHDIKLVSYANLIGVVGSVWQESVMRALLVAGYEHHRGGLQHPLCNEGYLLPPAG
jgi:hypothetical protein